MTVEPRISNPAAIEVEDIRRILAAGREPIVQFSTPPSADMLERVNELCRTFGEALEVRFYTHFDSVFDADLVALLPDVRWLTLDCLRRIRNVERVADLPHLTRFGFGVEDFDRPDFLDLLPLERLTHLSVGENIRRDFDLSPLARAQALTDLQIAGHTRGIEAVAGLRRLRALDLNSIPKKQDLGFVSDVADLRSLRLVLGGRDAIDEIRHEGLETLEIIRVRGLADLGSLTRFPRLRRLHVEDQIRLAAIDLAGPPLEEVFVLNCKTLAILTGVSEIPSLRHLRVYGTGLDLNELARRDWPPAMDLLALYSGRVTEDERIRAILDARGYRAFS